MDDTHPQPQQLTSTPGVKGTMTRPGMVYRAGKAIAGWVQRMNLKYSKVGNPPVYDNAAFPWAADIEKEWPAIRAELDQVMTRREELPGFQEIVKDVSSISQDKGWKTFVFCAYGMQSETSQKACPETWRIVQKIPGLTTAMFSIFEPGKHLPAHRGPYNGVLRFHLGLIVPNAPGDAIAIRVFDQVCHWEEGKALIFDDAYEHEAWNHSDKVRVVLFVDFKKPLRFPGNLINNTILKLAFFTPFIQETWTAQKKWERLFFKNAPPHD